MLFVEWIHFAVNQVRGRIMQKSKSCLVVLANHFIRLKFSNHFFWFMSVLARTNSIFGISQLVMCIAVLSFMKHYWLQPPPFSIQALNEVFCIFCFIEIFKLCQVSEHVSIKVQMCGTTPFAMWAIKFLMWYSTPTLLWKLGKIYKLTHAHGPMKIDTDTWYGYRYGYGDTTKPKKIGYRYAGDRVVQIIIFYNY